MQRLFIQEEGDNRMIISNLYKTEIDCDSFGWIDNPLRIIVALKDFEEEYLSNKNVKVYIITPNPNLSENKIELGTVGELAQDYIFTYTPRMFGLYTIVCNHTKKQFLVKGNLVDRVNENIRLVHNETKVSLYLANNIVTSAKDNWKEQGTIPEELKHLRPESPVFASSFSKWGDWQIQGSNLGGIYFRNNEDSNSFREYIEITWSKNIEFKNSNGGNDL